MMRYPICLRKYVLSGGGGRKVPILGKVSWCTAPFLGGPQIGGAASALEVGPASPPTPLLGLGRKPGELEVVFLLKIFSF